MNDKSKNVENETTQTAEIGDSDLNQVAGGGFLTGHCFRCNGDVSWSGGLSLQGKKWFGKPCCDKCFELLSQMEQQGKIKPDYQNMLKETNK